MQHESTISKIRLRLSHVVQGLTELIRTLPVLRFEQSGSVIFLGPEYHWGKRSETQQAVQINLKRDYEPISELLRLTMRGAPKDFAQQFDEADKGFRVWLELEYPNYGLCPTPEANIKKLNSDVAKIESILAALDATRGGELILVPDTSSLLTTADPTEYRKVAGQEGFVFMLLPTVLGELDRLKVTHQNPDMREKARAAIKRIKGYRKQGALMTGVTVDKSISVKAAHAEPDMEATLSWLDGNVEDDRIMASVLELQEYPAASIILVTEDINLQNKADAALITTAELS
jgi:hypothetical protein